MISTSQSSPRRPAEDDSQQSAGAADDDVRRVLSDGVALSAVCRV